MKKKKKSYSKLTSIKIFISLFLLSIITVSILHFIFTKANINTQAFAAGVTSTDYPIPASADPWGTAFDSNGNVWIAVPGCDPTPMCPTGSPPGFLEEFNPNNSTWIATYQLPTGYTQPLFLAFDASGNLWFPLFMGNSIGMFNTTTHAFQQFIVPTANSGPWDIAIDKNGIIWFTEHFVNKIGRFDPVAHTFTEIATPASNSQPYGITVDRSGNVWFTENNPSIALIAKYTLTGQLLEYKIRNTLPGNSLTPHLIANDTNGNIWWSEGFVGMIGKLVVSKASPGTNNGVTEYAYTQPCGICGAHTSGIIVDNNGLVWFDDSLQGIFGSFPESGTGSFATFNSPSSSSHPHDGLQVDKQDRIWFDEEFGNKLAKALQGNIIGEDIFLRPNQTFWGTANDGQTWGEDAMTSSNFSIGNNTGKVTNGTTTYNAVLGPIATNNQVLFTGKMSSYMSSNIGAILHYTNSNNWYGAFIDGANLVIKKDLNGTVSTLKTTTFTAGANTFYSLRFQISGSTLNAKVWQASKNEPANWKLTASDTSFTSGNSGIQTTESTTTATVTSFTSSIF